MGSLAVPHQLLDTLECLPREVLRSSVWQPLEDDSSAVHLPAAARSPITHLSPARQHFRLACRRTRTLVDQLTRRLCLVKSQPDAALEAAHGAFLARQEHLQELQLHDHGDTDADSAHSERHITQALHLGGAACRRLQRLTILSSSGCTAAAGAAIRQACPQLHTLDLHPCVMETGFFAPWRDCHSLVKVAVTDSRNSVGALFGGGLLPALAALPSLQAVFLEGVLRRTDVVQLSMFARLSELDAPELMVDGQGAGLAHHLGTVLSRLTHLTKLGVPRLENPPSAPLQSEAMTILASHLSGLRRLQDLNFGFYGLYDEPGVVLKAGGLDALCQLTQLTRLVTCVLSGPPGLTGQLPLLQHLQIQGQLDIAALAATLRPLQPLPALRSVTCDVHFPAVEGDVASAHAAVAACSGVARLLADAPHLSRVDLSIYAQRNVGAGVVPPDFFSFLGALLQPLQRHLAVLNLQDLPTGMVGAVWPALARHAGRLRQLTLTGCGVRESTFVQAVSRDLPALRFLEVVDCDGLEGGTAVLVATARRQPLRMRWWPEPDHEQQRALCAVARPGVVVDP